MFCTFQKTGCDIGLYGENCTKCPDNCLNDDCHFQIGHCFDCKDGFSGEMCKGKQMCENYFHSPAFKYFPDCVIYFWNGSK